MTLEPFAAPSPPFASKPVNKSHLASQPDVGTGPIRLPARRRFQPSAMDPAKERTRRLMRDETQQAMVDAVWAVLEGLEELPFTLSLEQRTWLRRLISKPCRAHLGLVDELCPGLPACAGSVDDLVQCDHACPGPPDCMGSVGRFVACERSRVYEERNCQRHDGVRRAIALPLSCNVPACPHDEPRRQERHRIRYQAAAELYDPRDVVLGVLTAQNPADGALERGLRVNVRHLAKIRRTPVFTGRGPCLARTEDDRPFHPCAHLDHQRYRCRYKLCSDQDGWARKRSRRRRARRRCALSRSLGRPCAHEQCRPNCPTYRHRGVAALAFFLESPKSTRGPGWNLHTNFLIAMHVRCDEHPQGCPTRRGCEGARHFGWLAPWEELAWYWRRATCPRHRRCPGRPVCDGGAWDVHLEGYDPRKGVGEYVKYVTKPLELLDAGGPAALIEFLLARRRQKFVICAGDFYGRRFRVDPKEQRALDNETTQLIWETDTRKTRVPKRCPFGDHDADWDMQGIWTASGYRKHIPRADLELMRGVLGYRPPPDG